jgi:major vault protein
MAERDVRERDILVAPNEYAYVQDLTKGDIVLYVGPTKISLSNTERMIILRDGRFVPVRGDEAGLGVHRFVEASSSQYIILENPPVDPEARPSKGANSAVPLRTGRTIVVPGPAQFPLWPGQRAEVIDGHELRDDEYLVARVYDDDGGDQPIGTETIIRGSDVSFYVPPSGRQVVPSADGRYERRAWRLDKNRGLHVRVTAPFEAADGDQVPAGRYTPGQDLFVRGREGYFFPTESLEVIGAVDPLALADREAIYVRDRDSGRIQTVVGPANYLIDPTREELVRRPLGGDRRALYRVESGDDRAPTIYVPPSSAVMVTARDRREVVIGPTMRVLGYDDELEVLTLSTGRPKSDGELLPTCFLRIQGNKVSDRVTVKTADHVELDVTLSYRVSFTGDPDAWFNVKDYVGLLCDHLGSIIRAAVRASPIESFHERSTEILRSAILGPRGDGGERAGRQFAENGMWVYDVEVLDVRILDDDVDEMLCDAQRVAIVSDITRKQEQLRLGDEQLKARVEQEIHAARMAAIDAAAGLEARSRELELARAGTGVEVDRVRRLGRASIDADALDRVERTRLAVDAERAELEKVRLEARAAAFRAEMEAVAPELIATLKSLANKQLAGELTRNLSPLAILGGDSVAEVACRLLEKLPLGPRDRANGAGDLRALLGVVGTDPAVDDA